MAITRVHGASYIEVSVSTTNTITVTSSTAGNMLALAINGRAVGANIVQNTPTDNQSQTWIQAASYTNTGTHLAAIWYVLNTLSGVTSITVTTTATATVEMFAWEFSGVATSFALDGSIAVPNTATTAFTSGSMTTTNAADLVLACFGWGASAGLSSTAGGFTTEALLTSTPPGQKSNLQPAYRIVAATGTYALTGTLSAASSGAGAIAAFQAATSSTPISGSDTAAVADAATPGPNPGDTAAVAEGISGLALGRGDTMAVADRAAIALSVAETAAVADLGVASQGPAGSDSGAVAEGASLALSIADISAVAEGAAISTTLSAADSAAVADLGVVMANAPVPITDSDTATVVDGASIVITAAPGVPVRLSTSLIPGALLSTSVNPGP